MAAAKKLRSPINPGSPNVWTEDMAWATPFLSIHFKALANNFSHRDIYHPTHVYLQWEQYCVFPSIESPVHQICIEWYFWAWWCARRIRHIREMQQHCLCSLELDGDTDLASIAASLRKCCRGKSTEDPSKAGEELYKRTTTWVPFRRSIVAIVAGSGCPEGCSKSFFCLSWTYLCPLCIYF